MVKKSLLSAVDEPLLRALQQAELIHQTERALGMSVAQWQELQSQITRLGQAGDLQNQILQLERLGRWVASDEDELAASEIVGLLQAEDIDPDLTEAWIDAHRDEMTPALLAAIITTAMKHQRHMTAAKSGQTRRQNGRPARMLARYEELGSQGVVGQRRDAVMSQEFALNPANLHSTLSKARRARDKAARQDT